MRNRTRISSLDAFGLRDQRDRIYPALEASDGSTLSLDFTSMGGALDSRFTFSRASTATFINSSGLVQYADANLILQSESLATSPWAATNGASVADVSTTNPIGGSTATQLTSGGANNSVLQAPSLAANVPHTVRFWVRGGTSTQMQFGYFSGSFQTASGITVVGSGSVTGTGLMTITGLSTTAWTQVTFVLASPATASGSLLLYPDTASPTVGRTNFVWGVQINPGTTASAYNRTTTTAYHAPRFDYDPTTLAPRGLLIEGSATNVLENFGSSGLWGRSNIDGSGAGGVLANGQTGPDGVANTAARITTAATTTMTNMSVSRATNAAGNTRTFSVWLRGVGANTTASIAINGSNTPTGVASSQAGHAVTLTTSTSGNNLFGLVTGLSTTAWTRVSISRTDTQATPDAYRICPGNHNGTIASGLSLDVYVPQAESGIGMTSTIPTGSSSVQRAVDVCSMTGSNFSSWYGSPTAFSMLFEGIAQIDQAYARVLCLSSGANTASGIPNFNLGFPAAANNRPFMNAYVVSNNNIDTYVPVGGALTNGIPFKIGFRHQTSSHYITRGTSLGAANSYAGFAAGLANLYFGNTDGTIHRSVHYTRLKFWPSALSNAQLDLLAT